MIALLGCSINLLASNSGSVQHNLSMGGREQPSDSVLISYSDLKVVNSKLIELEYEKQINTKLRNIVSNDSIIINDYKTINEQITKDCKKAIKQRNIMFGSTALFFVTSLFLIFK